MLIASVSDIHLDYKANRALFIKMAAEIGARGAEASSAWTALLEKYQSEFPELA